MRCPKADTLTRLGLSLGCCRPGGEHHPHWGSIVGSVARGMRQVGLPLGRHHHTQHLDPERAGAAAATRKQVWGAWHMQWVTCKNACAGPQRARIQPSAVGNLRVCFVQGVFLLWNLGPCEQVET